MFIHDGNREELATEAHKMIVAYEKICKALANDLSHENKGRVEEAIMLIAAIDGFMKAIRKHALLEVALH